MGTKLLTVRTYWLELKTGGVIVMPLIQHNYTVPYIQWKSIQWKISWTAREKMKVTHVALKERFSEGCTYNKPYVFFLFFGIILIGWIGWYWKTNVSYIVSWNNLPSSRHNRHVCHKMTSPLAQNCSGSKMYAVERLGLIFFARHLNAPFRRRQAFVPQRLTADGGGWLATATLQLLKNIKRCQGAAFNE